MNRSNKIVSTLLCLLLLSPALTNVISANQGSSITTSLDYDSGYVDSQGRIVVQNSVNLTLTLETVNNNFIQGNFSYTGITNGYGSYVNNSVIPIYSNLTGEIIFNYSASGSQSNESLKSITIFFDSDLPEISLTNNQYSLFDSNTINQIPHQVTISNKSSFFISCYDNQSLSNISITYGHNSTNIYNSNSQFNFLFRAHPFMALT